MKNMAQKNTSIQLPNSAWINAWQFARLVGKAELLGTPMAERVVSWAHRSSLEASNLVPAGASLVPAKASAEEENYDLYQREALIRSGRHYDELKSLHYASKLVLRDDDSDFPVDRTLNWRVSLSMVSALQYLAMLGYRKVTLVETSGQSLLAAPEDLAVSVLDIPLGKLPAGVPTQLLVELAQQIDAEQPPYQPPPRVGARVEGLVIPASWPEKLPAWVTENGADGPDVIEDRDVDGVPRDFVFVAPYHLSKPFIDLASENGATPSSEPVTGDNGDPIKATTASPNNKTKRGARRTAVWLAIENIAKENLLDIREQYEQLWQLVVDAATARRTPFTRCDTDHAVYWRPRSRKRNLRDLGDKELSVEAFENACKTRY